MQKIDVSKFMNCCEGTLLGLILMHSVSDDIHIPDTVYDSLYSMTYKKKFDIPYALYGYTTSSENNSKSISKIPKCLYWYIMSFYNFDSERMEFKFIGVDSYEALNDVIKNSLEYFGLKSRFSVTLKLDADGVYHEDYYNFASDAVRFSHITGEEEIFKGLDNFSREDKIGILKVLMDEDN